MRLKFDDIIRQRWEKRTFPVDDLHRDAMIKLLEEQKRRRIIPLWWIGSAIVAIALGIFLVWSSESGAPQSPTTYPPTSSEQPPSVIDHTTPDAPRAEADRISTKTDAAMVDNTQMPSASSHVTGPRENKTKAAKRMVDPGSNSTLAEFTNTKVTDVQYHPTIVNDSHEAEANPIQFPLRNTSVVPGLESLAPGLLSHAMMVPAPDVTPVRKRKKMVYLFGEAGAAMLSASKPAHDKGSKLNIGAGLGYSIAPGIHLTASAGYLMQNGGFDFERTSTVRHSGFGVRSQFNRIAPDRLHFVYSKLGLQARSRKHMLVGYAGLQKLYGAQGYIDTYTSQQLPPTEKFAQEYTWLNTNGLQEWQWYTGVAYGYRLTPRLTVMAGTDYYFTSIVKQDATLAAEGYYWKGSTARWQPFFTLNYLLYGLL